MLSLIVLPAFAFGSPSEKLTGKLDTLKGVRVLSLTGTPRQNGYTQGFLLASDIMALGDHALAAVVIFARGASYDVVLERVDKFVTFTPREQEEADGIMAGIRDRLGEDGLTSKVLGRKLTARDLLTINALPDIRGMGCSSFAAWGSRTSDGGMIVGRNLDYFGRHIFSPYQLLVVCVSPDPKYKSWVAMSLTGAIGLSTVVNRDGVLQAAHDSSGLPARPMPPLRIRSGIARDCIEAISREGNVPENAAAFCRKHHTPCATNFLFAGPSGPAGTLEYDLNLEEKQGVTVRFPPEGQDWLVTTNHFRARKKAIPCNRYESLADALKSGSKLATLEDGWKLITRASVDGTLQTMVYMANGRRLLLSFSTTALPAHKIKPVEFTLDELFANAGE